MTAFDKVSTKRRTSCSRYKAVARKEGFGRQLHVSPCLLWSLRSAKPLQNVMVGGRHLVRAGAGWNFWHLQFALIGPEVFGNREVA